MTGSTALDVPAQMDITPADEAWDALNSALEEYVPPCDGEELFTADDLTTDERRFCELVCSRCWVALECEAYATAAGVEAGFWAGRSRSPKRNRARWKALSPASQGDPAVPP